MFVIHPSDRRLLNECYSGTRILEEAPRRDDDGLITAPTTEKRAV